MHAVLRLVLLFMFGLGLATAADRARAQVFPDRPIRFFVPLFITILKLTIRWGALPLPTELTLNAH